ncbi:histidinol-phosphate transaminase [Changpingibacter yushuensis]|uniref:histidinol-phosphate transaminase n=1 Tax=Changpingibacter yushuensis TaxID=2758440 RepID=UPI00165E5FF4|nr:histidinol-phosphate transaminase [Changpingibacter yushuensis]
MENADQMWFRPEVLSLPAYVPGKKGSRDDVIKLASNETPFPALPQVQAVIAACAGDLNRYPDMYAGQLVSDIAAFCEWPDDGIVVGNGSTAIIEKILQAVVTPGGEVVLPWRSFEAYPIAIQSAGGVSVKVPLRHDGGHDLRAMVGAITSNTRAILLCSPNNPTGVSLTHTEVQAFLAEVPPTIPVILDEAYIDFVEMADKVNSRELLLAYENLVVLHTFSKAYGLAGLRCGYALTCPAMAAGLRAISTPFGVNALAQAAASAALRSQPLVREQVEVIKAERTKFVAALKVQGWNVPDSQANFLWLALGKHSAMFEELCNEEGVTVRRFGSEGVRVSVAEPRGSLRVLRALQRLRQA